MPWSEWRMANPEWPNTVKENIMAENQKSKLTDTEKVLLVVGAVVLYKTRRDVRNLQRNLATSAGLLDQVTRHFDTEVAILRGAVAGISKGAV